MCLKPAAVAGASSTCLRHLGRGPYKYVAVVGRAPLRFHQGSMRSAAGATTSPGSSVQRRPALTESVARPAAWCRSPCSAPCGRSPQIPVAGGRRRAHLRCRHRRQGRCWGSPGPHGHRGVGVQPLPNYTTSTYSCVHGDRRQGAFVAIDTGLMYTCAMTTAGVTCSAGVTTTPASSARRLNVHTKTAAARMIPMATVQIHRHGRRCTSARYRSTACSTAGATTPTSS